MVRLSYNQKHSLKHSPETKQQTAADPNVVVRQIDGKYYRFDVNTKQNLGEVK